MDCEDFVSVLETFIEMKIPVLLTCMLAFASGSNEPLSKKLHCQIPPAKMPRDWITMADPCVNKMKEQVQLELDAAMTYMAMAAHFSQDKINRPGFANFFFDAASEERGHAMKIIGYLLMRGELTENIRELIRKPAPEATSWPNAVEALKAALKMETRVTEKIRDIIAVCEKPSEKDDAFNDYNLADYLSGDFLDEQYKGQKQLASYITIVGKMMDHHGEVGEFLFDKKLLDKKPIP